MKLIRNFFKKNATIYFVFDSILLIIALIFLYFKSYEFLLTIAFGIPLTGVAVSLIIKQGEFFTSKHRGFFVTLLVLLSRYIILIATLLLPALIIFLLNGRPLFFIVNFGIIIFNYLILVLNKNYL